LSRARLAPPDIEYTNSLAQVAYLLLREGQKGHDNPFNFRLNLFTSNIELNGVEVNDTDLINATMQLELGYRWRKYPPSLSRVWEAARWVAQERGYHPVQEYLTSLEWDKRPRIHRLFGHYADAIGNDLTLLETQSKKVMLGAVARVMQAGCKLDTMPILIGGQGCGKSTFCRILAARSNWYSDTPIDLKNKDAYQALNGVWIMEIAELKSLQGASAETRKAFLSSQRDRYRPPYGRTFVTMPRQVLFIGTSNRLELHDSTGARRYWPIPVHRPRLDDLKNDVDQLWAEAYTLYSAGSSAWHIDNPDMLEALKKQAEAYTVADPWRDSLISYATGIDWFTISDFLSHIGISEAAKNHKNTLRVARLCRSLNMETGRSRSNGKRTRIWRYR
jgi:predicted P-loop ATPase